MKKNFIPRIESQPAELEELILKEIEKRQKQNVYIHSDRGALEPLEQLKYFHPLLLLY